MENEKLLHQQFVKLGNDRRKLTNELLALLPEIYGKKIYKNYAGSIVEYAGKFGGLSKGVVLKRLRLEKYLDDKNLLKEAIRTEGIHKVAMIASLATTENEEFLVDKIKNMSKSAIQELSKEMRANEISSKETSSENLFGEMIKTVNCKAVPQKTTIELDEEMSFLFLKLKKKFGKNLSNREVMKKILEIVESEQSTDQKVIPHAKGGHGGDKKIDINDYVLQKPITRYVPSKIKKQIISKTNGKCTYPNCNKPSEILHHAERFAASHSHNSLKPLCKTHHEFAHNGLIQNENQKCDNWNLNLKTTRIGKIDNQYRTHRQNSG